LLDRDFKTQGIQKNTLKSAKRTAYDNSIQLLHTFFGGQTLNIYKKMGIKFKS